MKKAINLSIFVACSILAISCGKDKKTDDFSYTVNNISQVTIEQNGSKTASYAVQLLSGAQEQVALSINGLPSGITASLEPATGIAPYNTLATFVANATVAKGTYNFIVTATSNGQTAKTFNSSIIVTSACGSNFFGNIRAVETCTIGSDDYTSRISPVTGIPNRINIGNFYNSETEIYADINCTTGSIIIPLQTKDGVNVSGSGTIDNDNQFKITYTIGNGSFTNTCTTIYTK